MLRCTVSSSTGEPLGKGLIPPPFGRCPNWTRLELVRAHQLLTSSQNCKLCLQTGNIALAFFIGRLLLVYNPCFPWQSQHMGQLEKLIHNFLGYCHSNSPRGRSSQFWKLDLMWRRHNTYSWYYTFIWLHISCESTLYKCELLYFCT